MELNNFEKQVQQKLSNREIKPSDNSWDRLDAMLSVQEKPIKKSNFRWIFIAASFILFASIGYYFYNQSQVVVPVKELPVVVDVEEKSEVVDQKELNNPQEVLVENNTIIKEEIQVSSTKKQKNIASSKVNNKQVIAVNEGVSIVNQSQSSNNSEITNEQSTIKNKYVSPKKLLAEVSTEDFKSNDVKKQIKKAKKGISVNPNALLTNVENELNQSFKDNAIERLNRNFNSIKTVLANRNYEE